MFGGSSCWNVWAGGVQRHSLQARGDKHDLFTAGCADRMWGRSCNPGPTAALGQRKLPSVGEDAVSPSSWLNPPPHPRRSCRLCPSSASRPPTPPPLWRSRCWNSWGRSSCSSRTPPDSTSGSRASCGRLWWGGFCVGKHFKGGRAHNWTLSTCTSPGFSEMRDCLHHLFHRVHHGRVQIRGRLLQGRRGKFILAIPIPAASFLGRPDASPPRFHRYLVSSPPSPSLWTFISFSTSWPLSWRTEDKLRLSRHGSEVTDVTFTCPTDAASCPDWSEQIDHMTFQSRGWLVDEVRLDIMAVHHRYSKLPHNIKWI